MILSKKEVMNLKKSIAAILAEPKRHDDAVKFTEGWADAINQLIADWLTFYEKANP